LQPRERQGPQHGLGQRRPQRRPDPELQHAARGVQPAPGPDRPPPALLTSGATVTTVRGATLDVLRACGLTPVFSNPGSTEVPLLAGWPRDLRFVLALHEASVVGMATGWAI